MGERIARRLNLQIGWIGRGRTYDLRINSAPLLPLSYYPVKWLPPVVTIHAYRD